MSAVSSPLELLHQYFGHPTLRPAQIPVVEAVLNGTDVLAVMPTGSGKSLCFQLPALALPGLTLVVSPLISLMKDQVDELVKRGIGAAALHSGQTADERRDILRRAHAGDSRWTVGVADTDSRDPGGKYDLRVRPTRHATRCS